MAALMQQRSVTETYLVPCFQQDAEVQRLILEAGVAEKCSESSGWFTPAAWTNLQVCGA